ncbi:hypothetical protein ACHAXS_013626 [Conticribra weissflogii]
MLKKASAETALGKLKKKASFPRGILSLNKSNSESDKKALLNDNIFTENPSRDPPSHGVRIPNRMTQSISSPFHFMSKSSKSISSGSTKTESLMYSYIDSDDLSGDKCKNTSVFSVFQCKSPEDEKGELLARIDKLQRKLKKTNKIVASLHDELDAVYMQKEEAVRKLDKMMKNSKKSDASEHEELKEIHLMLSGLSEKSDITVESALVHINGWCACFDD